MQRLRYVLFAWWFLMAGQGGSFAPSIYMVIGPFNTKEACDALANQVKAQNEKTTVFPCWEGERAVCK